MAEQDRGQTVRGAVATRNQKADKLVNWLRKQQDDIAMAAASHIKPSAIVRVGQGALRRNPDLMAAAISNPGSLLYAMLDAARLGHEPGTDEYYLVPFGGEVTGIEGYKGIIERMFRAGGVSAVVAEVVRKKDDYHSRGATTPPFHEYNDFLTPDERGPMIGAYAYALDLDRRCSYVVRMGEAEIMLHKAASRGADKSSSPWQKWEPAMWKKTVLRALEPYVPTSTEYRDTRPQQPASVARIIDPAHGRAEDVQEAEIVDDPVTRTPAADNPPPQDGQPFDRAAAMRDYRRLFGVAGMNRKADDLTRLRATELLADPDESLRNPGWLDTSKDLDDGQLRQVTAMLDRLEKSDDVKGDGPKMRAKVEGLVKAADAQVAAQAGVGADEDGEPVL